MLCKKVSKLLSEYFDGVLDADMSVRVSQHLKKCLSCGEELDRLRILHDRLSSVEKVQAPDYAYNLFQIRLADEKKNTWYNSAKDALELLWARIRSAEVLFFWTRPLGTLMATLCFLFISLSIDPSFYTGYSVRAAGRSTISNEFKQEFIGSMGSYFRKPSLKKIAKDDQVGPAMDTQSLIDFGERYRQGLSDTADSDLKLVTTVDSSGMANPISTISPEAPVDHELLLDLNKVIEGANYRPASMNGRSVHSWLVVVFNGITIYDR